MLVVVVVLRYFDRFQCHGELRVWVVSEYHDRCLQCSCFEVDQGLAEDELGLVVICFGVELGMVGLSLVVSV